MLCPTLCFIHSITTVFVPRGSLLFNNLSVSLAVAKADLLSTRGHTFSSSASGIYFVLKAHSRGKVGLHCIALH